METKGWTSKLTTKVGPSKHCFIWHHVLNRMALNTNKCKDVIIYNFFTAHRGEKIEKLCGVMGVEWPYDPDKSYELTTDNLKKILAIHMRFR